jgi:GH15 family glucan-1,4-alpha-glucosidase
MPTERTMQSAAAQSPFPPIAEYAFLSNCHTGALVAPDGAIDWLCGPRFDSPSIPPGYGGPGNCESRKSEMTRRNAPVPISP